VQVHDRSVVCTLALARWMDYPVTAELREAVAQVTEVGCSTAGSSSSGRSGSASGRRPAGSATRTRWRLNVSTKRSTCAWGTSSWIFRLARSISGPR
jgi:hypothetical protein